MASGGLMTDTNHGKGSIQIQAVGRHYSVKEIAGMWNLDENTISRIFKNEDGVLVIGTNRLRRNARHYATLRKPELVLLRVYQSRVNRASASSR
jgi:hypothetical protein